MPVLIIFQDRLQVFATGNTFLFICFQAYPGYNLRNFLPVQTKKLYKFINLCYNSIYKFKVNIIGERH